MELQKHIFISHSVECKCHEEILIWIENYHKVLLDRNKKTTWNLFVTFIGEIIMFNKAVCKLSKLLTDNGNVIIFHKVDCSHYLKIDSSFPATCAPLGLTNN